MLTNRLQNMQQETTHNAKNWQDEIWQILEKAVHDFKPYNLDNSSGPSDGGWSHLPNAKGTTLTPFASGSGDASTSILSTINTIKPSLQLNMMKVGLQSCGVTSKICQQMSQRRQSWLNGGRCMYLLPEYKHNWWSVHITGINDIQWTPADEIHVCAIK